MGLDPAAMTLPTELKREKVGCWAQGRGKREEGRPGIVVGRRGRRGRCTRRRASPSAYCPPRVAGLRTLRNRICRGAWRIELTHDHTLYLLSPLLPSWPPPAHFYGFPTLPHSIHHIRPEVESSRSLDSEGQPTTGP